MSRFGQRPGDRERGQSDRQQRTGGNETGGRPQRGGDRDRRSTNDRQQGAAGRDRQAGGWSRDNNAGRGDGPRRYDNRDQRAGGNDRPKYGDRPAFGDRPKFGDRDRPQRDDRQRDDRRGGDRPQYGGGSGRPQRSGDQRSSGGGDRPRFGDRDRSQGSGGPRSGSSDRPQRSGSGSSWQQRSSGSSDRPKYGDRDQQRSGGSDRPRFGDRSQGTGSSDRPRYGDRSQSSSDRPRYGDRDQQRSGGGDRPRYGDRDQQRSGSGDRPRFGDRNSSNGDRPQRSGSSWQQRSTGSSDRPKYGERSGGQRSGGQRPSYGDRDKPHYDNDNPRYGGSSRPQRPEPSSSWQQRSGSTDRPKFGDRDKGRDKPRSTEDRPRKFDQDRKPRTGSTSGARPERKPRHGSGDKPKRFEATNRDRQFDARPEPVRDERPDPIQDVTPIEPAVEVVEVPEAVEAEAAPTYDRLRAPELPEGADISALDGDARMELRSLPKSLAETVGGHLVAAGMLVDEDPERALAHARYARTRAARVGLVREAAGLTAYHAGEWAEALSELRAARRMANGPGHIAVMADCERALGRPERAIELARESAGLDLTKAEQIELKIVVAGARRDMGQIDASVVALQGEDLDVARHDPWSARLFYAYADNLAAAGRTEDAVRWFMQAAEVDDDEETDASERAVELSEGTQE